MVMMVLAPAALYELLHLIPAGQCAQHLVDFLLFILTAIL